MSDNIWSTSTISNQKIFLRYSEGQRFGLVRYSISKGMYAATLTERYEEMTVDTTKMFKSLLEALLWIDLMLNEYYGLDYPEEYPKGLLKDFM